MSCVLHCSSLSVTSVTASGEGRGRASANTLFFSLSLSQWQRRHYSLFAPLLALLHARTTTTNTSMTTLPSLAAAEASCSCRSRCGNLLAVCCSPIIDCACLVDRRLQVMIASFGISLPCIFGLAGSVWQMHLHSPNSLPVQFVAVFSTLLLPSTSSPPLSRPHPCLLVHIMRIQS